MDPDHSIAAISIVVCLILLALTSAVDAALSAISRRRLNPLQNEDASRVTLFKRLLDQPYQFKAATILLNAAALIGATAATLHLTNNLTIGWQAAALGGLLVLVLVVGEALPKALALRNPQGTASLLAAPFSLLSRLLWPIVALIGWLVRPLVQLLSGQAAPTVPLVSEEEIRHLVTVGEEEGLLEPGEREMIEDIFTFGDTLVREVMVPRVDIVALESTTRLDEAVTTILNCGHSRIPVYNETIDQIVGLLYAKDILRFLRGGVNELPLPAMLRQPYFVPDSMKVDALLKDLRTRRIHLAIVVDEYGGTAGLVTIEDLLEEIVGEIQDEYDVEEPSLQFVGEGELLADARVLLDDINDLTGLELTSDQADRIGGLVYEQLGRVPKVGDLVELPSDVTITVLSVEGLGPRQLRITYQPTAALDLAALDEEAVSDKPT